MDKKKGSQKSNYVRDSSIADTNSDLAEQKDVGNQLDRSAQMKKSGIQPYMVDD